MDLSIFSMEIRFKSAFCLSDFCFPKSFGLHICVGSCLSLTLTGFRRFILRHQRMKVVNYDDSLDVTLDVA